MLTYIYIHMADDEWSTTHSMDAIAEEQFALHPEVPNLVVSVYEHAGWYLDFAKQDGKTIVVGTANDAAAITPERRRFWERCRKMPVTTLPGIRRNNLPEEERNRHRIIR